jgi:hypothetical protein
MIPQSYLQGQVPKPAFYPQTFNQRSQSMQKGPSPTFNEQRQFFA